MQLRTKILLNNVVLAGLMLVSTATSFVALGTQAETTRFLSQDARGTAAALAGADAAIGEQLLAVERTLSGQDAAGREHVAAAGQKAEQALRQLADSPLIASADLQRLQASGGEFLQALQRLTTAHGSVIAAEQALDEHTDSFNELSTVMEEVGDGAVEVLEKSPDQPMAWGKGLKDIWEAADGGMENRIGLLAQYLALGELEAGRDPQKAVAAIDAALNDQKETASRMLATPTFDVPAPAKFGQITLRDLYTREFAVHERRMRDYATALVALPPIRNAYASAAANLRQTMREVDGS
jgi:hypothetical protein